MRRKHLHSRSRTKISYSLRTWEQILTSPGHSWSLDNTIRHRGNKCSQNKPRYRLDSDLSSGKKIIFVNSLRFSFHWVNASSEQVPFGELTILNTGLQSRQGSDSCFSCVNQVKKFVMREITKEELDLWTRTGGVVEKLENWTAPYRDHLRRYTETIDIFFTMAGPRHTHFRIFGPF